MPAIAHECQLQAARRAEVFADGLHVGQRLAGMEPVAERVDHGNARPAGQIIDRLLLEGPRYNSTHPAVEIAGHILKRFPHADAALIQYGEAAELLDRQFERHPRAQRGLLKEQCDGFTRQRRPVFARRILHVGREIEQSDQFVRSEVEILPEIAHGNARKGGGSHHEFLCTPVNI